MDDDLKYWIALSKIQKLGPVRFQKIIARFSNMEQVWQAGRQELMRAGLDQATAEEIIIQRAEINPNQEIEKAQTENIKIITINDANYPRLLKQIPSPPPLLYIKGEIKQSDDIAIAIVGSRKMTRYGQEVTQNLSSSLAENGLTIISGLAFGIDACAQKAACDANGRTIAVLGSGVDEASIYPTSNRALAKKVIENGALVSEFPIGTIPFKSNFPRRNRIISGLALGVLVIEAAEKSGSLITAKFALEHNREVFAVPGPIFSPTSIGANNLIKLGAQLVTEASDILDILNIEQASTIKEARDIIADSPEEEQILKHLSREPIHVDIIIKRLALPTSQVLSIITLMEIKGKIKNVGGSNYVLKH